MIYTKLKRVIRAGFINFLRNSFISLASVLVMTITLFVIGSLIFLSATFNSTLENLKSKVDVNVYFTTTASEVDILAIRNSLLAMSEVKDVQYESREQALTRFKKRHENDQLTLQALDELGDNPLGASLNVRARETNQYETIIKFLGSHDGLSKDKKQIIEKINYYDNKAAIDKLNRVMNASENVGWGIIVFMAIVSVLITFNTIRLAIYISREEIAVMKLVGASNKYIKGPFVVTGVLYGLAAGLITLILFYPLLLWLGPKTASFFLSIDLWKYFISNFAFIFLIVIGSGVFLGAVSSYLAVRRYLF